MSVADHKSPPNALSTPIHSSTQSPRVQMLMQEHRVLVRYLANLQRRISELVSCHQQQVRHWQDVLMRQSIRLLLERTRADWHLLGCTDVTSDHDIPPTADAVQAAAAVMCQTACVMDDLHWRDGDLCRRTGQACTLADTLTQIQSSTHS